MDLRLGGPVGYQLLSALVRRFPAPARIGFDPRWDCVDEAHGGGFPEDNGAPKIEQHLGRTIWNRFAGKRVLDMGCGWGFEAVAIAEHGAAAVFGTDILPAHVDFGAKLAAQRGFGDRCHFYNPIVQTEQLERIKGSIDFVCSIDAFEHYREPEKRLAEMEALLVPGGRVLVSFGPPWLHPFGAHAKHFTTLPWIQVLFKEGTIFDVRAKYRDDGIRRFEDVVGGLNRMTVRRFQDLVEATGFEIVSFDPVPIKGIRALVANPLTREYFCSVVRCELKKPE